MKRLLEIIKGFYFGCDPYTGWTRVIFSVLALCASYITLIIWLEGL